MNASKIDETGVIDFHYARLQSVFLALHLQLAEESKRSGEFETTYKNKSGKEIEVTRSPDGKFASKGGSDSSGSGSDAKSTKHSETKTSNTVKLAKDVLSGETGNQVKDSLVAMTSDPDVKVGIRKASFAEILGGAGDAMSNASDYIGKKIKEAKTAVSKQPLGVIMGEVMVGSLVLAGVAGAAALAAGVSAPVAAGVVVAVNLMGLVASDSITTEKFRREKAEKFQKFQTVPTYLQMDESFQKLKKERAESDKLFKASKEAIEFDRLTKEAEARKSKQGR